VLISLHKKLGAAANGLINCATVFLALPNAYNG